MTKRTKAFWAQKLAESKVQIARLEASIRWIENWLQTARRKRRSCPINARGHQKLVIQLAEKKLGRQRHARHRILKTKIPYYQNRLAAPNPTRWAALQATSPHIPMMRVARNTG